MGSKAPERVFVLSHLTQIHPQAIQIKYLTQIPLLHHIPQLFDSRMIHEQVTGEHRHPPLGPGPRHGLGIRGVQRERLFDQNRLSGLDDLPRHARMGGGRGGDDDRIHGPEQRRHVRGDQRARILARYPVPDLRVRVTHGRQLGVGQPGHGPDVVTTPRAGSDNADFEPLHR